MKSITISSQNYDGKTINVVFYSIDNPSVGINLGTFTVPFTRSGEDIWGAYEITIPEYNNKICQHIVNPTPTPTPTITPTPTSTPTISLPNLSWSQHSMPVSSRWKSITYGNGKFVAVAYDSNIAAVSTDGINWTQSSLPSEEYWNSITYGQGKFVTVAENGGVATSEDGLTWASYEMPLNPHTSTPGGKSKWQSVRYFATSSTSFFVALAYDKYRPVYSFNGESWFDSFLSVRIETTNRFYDNCDDENVLCSVWTNWHDATIGNEIILSVGSRTAKTNDGVFWTDLQRTSFDEPSIPFLNSVAFGKGLFVGIETHNIYTSPNGFEWTKRNLPIAFPYLNSIIYVENLFVVVGGLFNSPAKYLDKVALSTDGINWSFSNELPSSQSWSSVAYGNNKLVAVSFGDYTNGSSAVAVASF